MKTCYNKKNVMPGKCGSHPETEEAHGSVIGHILSQLRPGMDLTKVRVFPVRLCKVIG